MQPMPLEKNKAPSPKRRQIVGGNYKNFLNTSREVPMQLTLSK